MKFRRIPAILALCLVVETCVIVYLLNTRPADSTPPPASADATARSAGLVGDVLKTDNWQEIKLFASTFLADMAGGLQEMRDQTTTFGDVTQVPKATAKNAALQGTAGVLNAYATHIVKIMEQDGYYVRVPARKQFYLYVTQTLDQSKAVRCNMRADLWQKKETTSQ